MTIGIGHFAFWGNRFWRWYGAVYGALVAAAAIFAMALDGFGVGDIPNIVWQLGFSIFGNATLDAVFEAVLAVLVLLAVLLAVFASAKEEQQRPAGTLSSVAARIRWRWLAVCLGLARRVLRSGRWHRAAGRLFRGRLGDRHH